MPHRTTIMHALDRASTLIGVILPLAAVIAAAYLTWEQWTTWRDVAILAGMYSLTSLGITVGFHRMLTHRSFEAHSAMRFVLLALGFIIPFIVGGCCGAAGCVCSLRTM